MEKLPHRQARAMLAGGGCRKTDEYRDDWQEERTVMRWILGAVLAETLSQAKPSRELRGRDRGHDRARIQPEKELTVDPGCES